MDPLDRLRALAAALPSDTSSVTLTRADLVALLGERGAAPADGPPRDLTVEEVAGEVHRADSTIRGWLLRGDLRGYKLNGRDWRVPRSALRSTSPARRAER
jgi:excisionase family DNA binding protein